MLIFFKYLIMNSNQIVGSQYNLEFKIKLNKHNVLVWLFISETKKNL